MSVVTEDDILQAADGVRSIRFDDHHDAVSIKPSSSVAKSKSKSKSSNYHQDGSSGSKRKHHGHHSSSSSQVLFFPFAQLCIFSVLCNWQNVVTKQFSVLVWAIVFDVVLQIVFFKRSRSKHETSSLFCWKTFSYYQIFYVLTPLCGPFVRILIRVDTVYKCNNRVI